MEVWKWFVVLIEVQYRLLSKWSGLLPFAYPEFRPLPTLHVAEDLH